MKDGSFTSLIILLVLFFVLPSLFKLLGQYTMGSKGPGKAEQEEEGTEAQEPGETVPEAPERARPTKHAMEESGRTRISNEPIHPKWF